MQWWNKNNNWKWRPLLCRTFAAVLFACELVPAQLQPVRQQQVSGNGEQNCVLGNTRNILSFLVKWRVYIVARTKFHTRDYESWNYHVMSIMIECTHPNNYTFPYQHYRRGEFIQTLRRLLHCAACLLDYYSLVNKHQRYSAFNIAAA